MYDNRLVYEYIRESLFLNHPLDCLNTQISMHIYRYTLSYLGAGVRYECGSRVDPLWSKF